MQKIDKSNRVSGLSRKILAGILVLLQVVCASRALADANESLDRVKEYQVKALFLYNFANFVKWPEEAFANKNSPLKMCLYGTVPFGEFLDVVNGTLIRDRTLLVLRTTEYDDIKSGCHILFVGIDEKERMEEFLHNLNHLFVLSVGNKEGFTEQGGIVNIHRTKDNAKFEINLAKAISSGLLISSDLLGIARIINAE